ncbi:MAG: DUF11 domain-containing protein [Novipirellula sp. JB048]
MYRRFSLTVLTCFAALSASALFSSPVSAQDSIQTGDGLIMLQAEMPDEIRVGESFTYEVKVTNASDNVMLHDVELRQRQTKGLTIESVSMQDKRSEDQDKGSTSEKSSDQEMMISMLKPGDSRTFSVKATADEEGELRSCLEIASYTPAICMTSKVVKPQLELTKAAPEKANRCDLIELEYTLKNGGSGDVGPVKVTDSLGEGLATIDGSSELSFEVDGLKAGDSRRFVARVYAQKTGEFSSRAMAKATDSDLKSRSKETTTQVISADLVAKVTGPGRLYGDELARFNAEVTNTGNIAAEEVRVKVLWPTKANLVDLGDPAMSRQEGSSNDSSAQKDKQGEPTVAAKQSGDSDQSGKQKSQSDESSMEMSEEVFVIDRLDAGQTASFEYAIRPSGLSELPTKVVATYVCTVDQAEGEAKATARTQSTAMARAKIVRLPAMQLMVIDDEDPVVKGDQVVYTIRVWNEGDAPDNDVKLKAELPDGLEFVSADGPTKNSQNGSTVTFEPIKTMEPGDRADYKITAKSTGDKAVRFGATLSSKRLPSEVSAEEPTRLFQR